MGHRKEKKEKKKKILLLLTITLRLIFGTLVGIKYNII